MAFTKLAAFDVDYAPARISKWRLARTGLQVTHIDQASPLVSGYFAVATECTNDSGAPHTLEHLVFMGSRHYPYKGLLDTLGNRLFLATNAWTGVDQTVYTLTTAGWQGFRALLPVYLDHLVNPTLTDAACLTEVYHVDGRGRERGVVFSEMQGIELQSWFISLLNLQRHMYPASLGYLSETGGLMLELRKLTNDQIRHFHRSHYRPDNLAVIVTGTVDEAELMATMEAVDATLAPLALPPPPRPFVDSAPLAPLARLLVHVVEFPERDESMGEVFVAWRGPHCDDDTANVALDMLGLYLTDSAILVLNRELVEVESPLATDIDYSTDDYLYTGINLLLNGVPTARLAEADARVKELVRQQADPANIDLEYLRQVVAQQHLKYISSTENSAQTLSNIAISEFIYAPDPTLAETLQRWTQSLAEYERVLAWLALDWAAVVKKWLVDNPLVSILGTPLAALQRRMRREAKQRLRQIKDEHGPEGLRQRAAELDRATAANEVPIPDALLLQFDKPDPAAINFIRTRSYGAGAANREHYPPEELDAAFAARLADDSAHAPLFFHFEHCQSRFATIDLVMSTTDIDALLLPYISVLEEIFTLPIDTGSGIMPHEEVVQRLNQDLLEYSLYHGYQGNNELVNVKLKFEAAKYARAVEWLDKVLHHAVFDPTRIKIIIEKIINSLPDKKRNEEMMMYSAQARVIYQHDLLERALNFITTEEFFRHALAQIERGDFATVSAHLEQVRRQLFANFKVFVVGGCEGLPRPVSTWQPFYGSAKSGLLLELPRLSQFKTEIGTRCARYAHLVASPATDTTHLVASTTIPTDYLHPDINKIALASEFLCAVEGPFWRGIRGTGLAYGASIRRHVQSGLLSFTVYRGSDAQRAIEVAREIVDSFCDGSKEIDALSVENTVAAIVNELANSGSNQFDAANNKISDNLMRRRGPDYAQRFLRELKQLTASDVVYALKKYFQPLFSSDHSMIFSCLPLAKVDGFKKHLEEEGFSVVVEEISAADVEGGACSKSGSDSDSDSDSNSGSDSDSDSDSYSESGSESESGSDTPSADSN